MPFVGENRFRRVLQKRMGSEHRECIFSTRRNFSFDRHMCTCVLCTCVTCAHWFLCSLGTSVAGQMEVSENIQFSLCCAVKKLQCAVSIWEMMSKVQCVQCVMYCVQCVQGVVYCVQCVQCEMCPVQCAMWNVLCAMWKDCNTQSFGRAVSLLRDETTVDQLAPSLCSLTSDN